MTLEQLRARAQERLTAALAERATRQEALVALRSQVADGDTTVTTEGVDAAIAQRDAADATVTTVQREVAALDAEIAREAEIVELSSRSTPTGTARPSYDRVARVGTEERQYAPHKERGFDQAAGVFRGKAKPGADFERDVAAAFLGDDDARERLSRHRAEERVERGEYLARAVGTGAFAGLTVPAYLTEFYAPKAAAGRPFADACNSHILPATGMTVNLARVTTSTDSDTQSSENAAVAEQDIDDTLLTFSVLTHAGQQTMSRQSIERGAGTEPVVMDDLYRVHATKFDGKLLNVATNGLTNVATSIAYTDASPTVAEFLPKISQAASAVESALLDQSTGDVIAVMNSRRWYWLTQGTSTSRPILAQSAVSIKELLGEDYAEVYGRGVRGVLPNNIPAIVDNNVATNLGAGTNEDEVYVLDRNEAHLWEDPDAPMFIRAEQTKAASLGVLLVIYSYYAFTFVRQPNAQKIAGTGLITPTWTGV